MSKVGATEQNFPSLLKRFQSLIIDQLFIISCMIVISMILTNSEEDSLNALRGSLLFILFFVYEPFCVAYGCSVGNYITGIRIRQFGNDEKRISLFNSYLRFVFKIFLGIFSFSPLRPMILREQFMIRLPAQL